MTALKPLEVGIDLAREFFRSIFSGCGKTTNAGVAVEERPF